MITGTRIIADLYRDSVSLMKLSATISALPSVTQAAAIMATPANIELLQAAGLLGEESEEIDAGPNEVLIAVQAADGGTVAAALNAAEAELRRASDAGSGTGDAAIEPARSQEMALERLVGANLALIATPGPFAAAEAWKALRLGINAMVFSDNVAVDDEIALKRYASANGLMVLGPDCGTAVIDGVPLGFANVVRRGPIGVIAASGSGLQHVICQIDRASGGISQAIGTGGRDLDGRVGGLTTLAALRALADDRDTTVIALIAKPPAPEVAAAVLAAASATGKPVVACLLGGDPAEIAAHANLHAATTLDGAANLALALARGDPTPAAVDPAAPPALLARATKPIPGRRFLRALYSGGTFCYEALGLLGGRLQPLHANVTYRDALPLDDTWRSAGHTVLDFGDDVFTRGRPHPMIDHRLRNERIVREVADPETAVLLLDIVLGHGAHKDPAAAMALAIAEARQNAGDEGPVIVGYVCGTAADPQGLARQQEILAEAGVLLADSNAQAVALAAAIIERAS